MPLLSVSLRALLKRLGLDDREAEVYLALLSMHTGKASAIAKAARQPRTHTYVTLRKLEEKGLVSEVDRGNALAFTAESPEKLLAYLDNRERDVRETKKLVAHALPFLKDMSASPEEMARVTMLKGKDGMRQIYRQALQGEFCAFFNPDSMYKVFGENVLLQLFGKDFEPSGRDLLVAGAGADRYIEEFRGVKTYHLRKLPTSMKFNVDALVYGNMVTIFSYDEDLTSIRIENSNIAAAFRTLFNALWEFSL